MARLYLGHVPISNRNRLLTDHIHFPTPLPLNKRDFRVHMNMSKRWSWQQLVLSLFPSQYPSTPHIFTLLPPSCTGYQTPPVYTPHIPSLSFALSYSLYRKHPLTPVNTIEQICLWPAATREADTSKSERSLWKWLWLFCSPSVIRWQNCKFSLSNNN